MNTGNGNDLGREGPDSQEIRAALGRLLASDDLRASPQLAAFLTYIVEQQLAGRSETIKGYTIATEALGRNANFDPQADPIVRVEATRLRRAIERYYGSEGRNDPIEIIVPKGTYVPRFIDRHRVEEGDPDANDPSADADEDALRPRGTEANDQATRTAAKDGGANHAPTARAEPAQPLWRNWHWRDVVVAALVFALSAALVTAFLAGRLQGRKGRPLAPKPSISSNIDISPMDPALLSVPVVRIEPFVELGRLVNGSASARGINLRLRDALARFDEVAVLAASSPQQKTSDTFPPQPPAPSSGPQAGAAPATYVLSGWIEGREDGRFTLSVSLTSGKDGRVVWTRQFDAITPDPEPGRTETAIVRQIATTIAQPYGVLFTDLRDKIAKSGKPGSRFGCLLAAYEYWQTFREADHLAARECLEAAATLEPPSALIYANLACIEVEAYRTGFNKRPGVDSLARAVAAAQEAVRLKPQSARAQQSLMAVLFSQGDFAEALQAGESARLANPYDTDILANLGARKIAVGDVKAGTSLIEEAMVFNTSWPPWYDFALFLGALVKNDRDAAHHYVEQMRSGDYPFSLLARTVDAVESGDIPRAETLGKRLIEVEPAYGRDPRGVLERYGATPAVINRMLEPLAKAGVTPQLSND